jgi:hypothetical protein
MLNGRTVVSGELLEGRNRYMICALEENSKLKTQNSKLFWFVLAG